MTDSGEVWDLIAIFGWLKELAGEDPMPQARIEHPIAGVQSALLASWNYISRLQANRVKTLNSYRDFEPSLFRGRT